MKKSSVLIRRAALFTAIVTLVAVAAGMSAFAIADRLRADRAALGQLLPQARKLAQSAAAYVTDGSALMIDEVDIFALSGGTVWLSGDGRDTVNLTDGAPCPDAMAAPQADALRGEESSGFMKVRGRRCAWAMVPVMLDGESAGALCAALDGLQTAQQQKKEAFV